MSSCVSRKILIIFSPSRNTDSRRKRKKSQNSSHNFFPDLKLSDTLFVGSRQRYEVIKAYQRLKIQPGTMGHTMVRRIIREVNISRIKDGKPPYQTDRNGGNSFIYRIMRDYNRELVKEKSSSNEDSQ